MVTFTGSDELREAEFVGTDLTGARFVESYLNGVVMRGVDLQGADIDAPWLMDTDMWLGRAVLEIKQPFHPIGLSYAGAEEDGMDMAVFATVAPPYAEVLQVRAGRVAMVREFLATVTSEMLVAPRKDPHDPGREQTILSCLHVILKEEWEHLRFAVRDLDAIEAGSARLSARGRRRA
jgi:DinB superfamily/Pentapeptide repeats (8 copies)